MRRSRCGSLWATMSGPDSCTDVGDGAPPTSRGPTRASSGAPPLPVAHGGPPQPVAPARVAFSPSGGRGAPRSGGPTAPGAQPGRATARSSGVDPPSGATAPGRSWTFKPAAERPEGRPSVAGGATGGVAPRREAAPPRRAAHAEKDFVTPPVVHVHGGLMEDVTGERSAGFLQWVDGAETITARDLVSRLFVNLPEAAARFIRLGSLYSTAARTAPLATAGSRTGGGDNGASGGEAEGGGGRWRRWGGRAEWRRR